MQWKANMKCTKAIFFFDDGSKVTWVPTIKPNYGPQMHDVKFQQRQAFEGYMMANGKPTLEQSIEIREEFVAMISKLSQ